MIRIIESNEIDRQKDIRGSDLIHWPSSGCVMASRHHPKSTASKIDDVLIGCDFQIGLGQLPRNYSMAPVTKDSCTRGGWP